MKNMSELMVDLAYSAVLFNSKTAAEEVLTLELKANYLENNTGIFRVHITSNGYCYMEFGYVIEADSLRELKEMVLAENRIWYVFDEELVERLQIFRKEVML